MSYSPYFLRSLMDMGSIVVGYITNSTKLQEELLSSLMVPRDRSSYRSVGNMGVLPGLICNGSEKMGVAKRMQATIGFSACGLLLFCYSSPM